MAFQTPVKLRFYDLDRAGMVFHGAYTRLFQDAFEDLMEDAGYVEKRLEHTLGVRVPVVDHHMRFPSPPEGDELTVRAGIVDLGTSSATFDMRVLDDDREVALAEIVRVCIDAQGEPTEIPAPLRAAWEDYVIE